MRLEKRNKRRRVAKTMTVKTVKIQEKDGWMKASTGKLCPKKF